MKDKPHLQLLPRTPSLAERSEKTIEWFRQMILTLNARNQWLWKELIFYRTACRVLSGIIAVEIAIVIIALIWSLS